MTLTCSICHDPLTERHHLIEITSTHPPYNPTRWRVCDLHRQGLEDALRQYAGTPTDETPTAAGQDPLFGGHQ